LAGAAAREDAHSAAKCLALALCAPVVWEARKLAKDKLVLGGATRPTVEGVSIVRTGALVWPVGSWGGRERVHEAWSLMLSRKSGLGF